MKLKYNTRKVNWSAIEDAIKRVRSFNKHRDHLLDFFFLKSHRKNDPYFYISAKVRSFENFTYEPGRNNLQVNKK
jgi:hypothetical protein